MLAVGLTLGLIACGDSATTSTTTTVTKPTKPVTVLFFGDSVTQGYGLANDGQYYELIAPGKTYVDLLRARISAEKINEFTTVNIINDSVGGEFSTQALDRLPTLLAIYNPTHVVLAHGTNDAGSLVSNDFLSGNFSTMISMVRGAGAVPLLADVTYTRYGADYAAAYSQMVVNTAKITNTTYIPILAGVAGNPNYYFDDGFHMNTAAQPIMMQNVWDKLIPLF